MGAFLFVLGIVLIVMGANGQTISGVPCLPVGIVLLLVGGIWFWRTSHTRRYLQKRQFDQATLGMMSALCVDVLAHVDGNSMNERNLREWARGIGSIINSGVPNPSALPMMIFKLCFWINQHVDGSNAGERELRAVATEVITALQQQGLVGADVRRLDSDVPPFPQDLLNSRR